MGRKLFVGVGSASNLDDPDEHPSESRRANILEYTPDGKFVKSTPIGIRNPSWDSPFIQDRRAMVLGERT